jgi:hypothetical protein
MKNAKEMVRKMADAGCANGGWRMKYGELRMCEWRIL